jgi:hypothetical protein
MTGYRCDMAKSLDADARQIDAHKAITPEFADAAQRRRRENRAAAMRSLLRDASRHGGYAAERVRATRPGW